MANRLEAAVCNNKGRKRGNNEDNFYLSGSYMKLETMDNGGVFTANRPGGIQLYAVCDGMGGAESGEKASFHAVETLSLYHEAMTGEVEDERLVSLLRRISDTLYDEATRNGIRSGTTIVLCVWNNGEMRCLHVGDSRIYLLSDGKLTQVTQDHSEVQRLVSLNLMTPEQAKVDPGRHVISQYLGMNTEDIPLAPSLWGPVRCKPGDTFLLCSDGLTDMVEDDVIAEILQAAPTPKAASERLVQKALENGGVDNVTCMCLRVARGKSSLPDKLRHALRPRKLMRVGGTILGVAALCCLLELLFRRF